MNTLRNGNNLNPSTTVMKQPEPYCDLPRKALEAILRMAEKENLDPMCAPEQVGKLACAIYDYFKSIRSPSP